MVSRRLIALFAVFGLVLALILPALAQDATFSVPEPVTGVSLVLPEDSAQEGGFQLGYEIEPESASNAAVLWSSSDEAVAAVSQEGYVTYIGPGTVTITVTTRDGGFTDSLTFTVKSTLVAVETIALSPSLAMLEQGSTAFVTVSILPENASDQAVSWQTDDPAVASVSQVGQITANMAGAARITATTRDGSKTAQCLVIVPPSAEGTLPERIDLNQNTISLTLGSTAFLRAEMYPAEASEGALIWASSCEDTVGVDENGVISALAPGMSTITVVGAGGVRASCEVTVLDPQADTQTGQDPIESQPQSQGLLPRISSYPGFGDVQQIAWYYESVKAVVEQGIMQGYADGSFGPDREIRLCEAVKMAAVVHAAVHDERADFTAFLSEPWYAPYVAYCIRVGMIQADDFPDLERSATRAEMAYLFYGAVGPEHLAVLNADVSIQDVGDDIPQAEAIKALYAAGVLTGDNSLTRAFRPREPISRAEAAAIISRITLPDLRIQF